MGLFHTHTHTHSTPTEGRAHTGASVEAVVCAVVHLASLSGEVRPAVAAHPPLLIGQAAASVLTGRPTQLSYNTHQGQG